MSRLLQRLSVLPYLEGQIVLPKTFTLRRWNDGECIAGMRTGEFEKDYGSPCIQVHRGDLHQALLSRSRELGVQFQTSSKVPGYDSNRPSVTLEGGGNYRRRLNYSS